MGLVCDVFDETAIRSLRGSIAVGHVRYSTTGSSSTRNIQPFVVNRRSGHYSIVHNGNLTNTVHLPAKHLKLPLSVEMFRFIMKALKQLLILLQRLE